ncbi:MAG: tetratricopeptide repeat protein [Phycisphaerales bacterium]
MALFGKKKEEEVDSSPSTAVPVANPGAVADVNAFQPQPAKARKWFDFARTQADSSNHEAALSYFANGLKLDPDDIAAHKAMYESAVRFFNAGGKPASGREIKEFDGEHVVDRFVAAEFAWMRSLTNSTLGVRMIEAAAVAQQNEFGRWIAPKLLNLLRNQKKPSKSAFVAAMRAFGTVGAWETSILAGEIARSIDPSDGELAAELKNLSAQRAMDQGGYEDAGGQEGGFRKFVQNSDKQREIEEAQSLSGSGGSHERVIERAREAYTADPTIPENINRYAAAVRRGNSSEAEDQAYRIFMKGYADTKEFRFRMAASDIKIGQVERMVRDLQQRVKAAPDDGELQAELEQAQRNALLYKSAEYAERETQYPTDRTIKFQRGEVEFQLQNYHDAMAAFQQAKDEPKLRVRAGHRLGLCFAREGWHSEAESEFREAMENIDATTRDYELPIRYDLMESLLAQANEDRSIDRAKEALEICSTIARKDITYRDIRARRKEIDELFKELS